MGIKKKLGLGIAAAALGISLVGGGTFAYFNDVETSNNTFAAGTLDLTLDPQVIFNVDNLKPGDTMKRYFELQNTGSLDIAKVLLDTSYTVDSEESNQGQDMGEHFMVHFIKNQGHPEHWLDDDSYEVVGSKTLKQLSDMTPDELAVELEDFLIWDYKEDGIPASGTDYLVVKIEFVDNEQNQNIFQGDTLNLEWKFTAEQEDGERR
ncbi:CalY family protein [Aquibacillus koreensis]|uniref:CalY family protein n=1 Tax=Aquibacillus koreensis TaxID=279446 RepID=A0A9X4AHB3_9BACI|nr:CalY family protein [Aquibacillus koreensis]MCT2534617.1 CalY family protein [Aquibacillus koreensis]MDC3419801.1 CalY family protein [Aquibacillus koreensis]